MAGKTILFDAKNRPINQPVFMNFFREWRDWWEGFDERDQSRLPTLYEKQKMILYPITNSIIQHKVLPLLAPHITFDGDEKQVEVLKYWFEHNYRRCMKPMYKKSVTWGFSVGERIIETVYIDNKPYWIHVGSFIPEPFNTTFKFGQDKPDIVGFEYNRCQVERYKENGDWMMPGMVYMNYEGDEISMPKGDSILNKLFWAWQLVMKTWTSMVVYQRLHSPFLKYFYEPGLAGDSDNKAVNQARTQALSDLRSIKNTQGVALPLHANNEGKLEIGADLDVVAPEDREPSYNNTIRVLNSLMYVAVNFPERLSEQFKDTGSQSMVSEQKTFYTEYILPDDIKNAEHYCHEWFTNPMLETNFGKIDCTYKFSISDKQKAYYVALLEQLISSGEALGVLDVKAIAESAGVPIKELQEPTVETAERKTMVNGIDFAINYICTCIKCGYEITLKEGEHCNNFKCKKCGGQMRRKERPGPGQNELSLDEEMTFAAKRGDEKKRLKAQADKWATSLNKQIGVLKDDIYKPMRVRLQSEMGKIGLKIERLFKKKYKEKDIEKVVQISRTVFSGTMDQLLIAWAMGQKVVFETARKKNPKIGNDMEIPSTSIKNQLRRIAVKLQGTDLIPGEGELLERRLYVALLGVTERDEAMQQFSLEFNKYVDEILPLRLNDAVHQATQYGIWDAAKEIYIRDLRAKKEQK